MSVSWRPGVLCVLAAAFLGLAYVLIAPKSADMAAAVFRADLFARNGLVVWNDAWYGGHHIPAYSALFPPLGALLGPRLVAAIAVAVASGLFAALVRPVFGERAATAGAVWFALGASAHLLTGRVPFLLGLPLALGALLAARSNRVVVALGLAALTGLASPVAAAFLGLAGVAWRRRLGWGLALAALTPVIVLTRLFPEGGTEPFVPSAFWPGFVALCAFALFAPRDHPALRVGAALYALAFLACFLLPTPVGGNVTRLASLMGGPIVACLLWGRRPVLLAVLAVPLLYWQLMPPIRDVVTVTGDPSTQASYYEPLVARLKQEPGPIRVEVPFTRTHWEAAMLAPHVPLARGWERQLDRQRNALFYDEEPLSASRYEDWLRDAGVSFVALPDVPLDDSAKAEARLIRQGLPYLQEIWQNENWRLFAVRDARPLVGVGAGFATTGPGVVRVRYSPHWVVVDGAGCVSRAPGGWTRVDSAARVSRKIDPWRALSGQNDPRCTRADG